MNATKKPGPTVGGKPGDVKNSCLNNTTARIEINQVLPHNSKAEKELIENLIFRPAKIGFAMSMVEPSDFYSMLRGQVYERIIDFHKAGRAFNGITLEDSFQGDENYLRYRDFFDELLPWTGETVGHNARIIKECSNQRKLIAATYQANADLFNSVGVDVVKENLELVLAEVA